MSIIRILAELSFNDNLVLQIIIRRDEQGKSD